MSVALCSAAGRAATPAPGSPPVLLRMGVGLRTLAGAGESMPGPLGGPSTIGEAPGGRTPAAPSGVIGVAAAPNVAEKAPGGGAKRCCAASGMATSMGDEVTGGANEEEGSSPGATATAGGATGAGAGAAPAAAAGSSSRSPAAKKNKE